MNKTNKHILIIDDDKAFAFITFKFIKKIAADAKIELKMSGQTGIQHLETSHNVQNFPQLITLDLNMPLGDGASFLQYYKNSFYKKYPNTKIVVISDMSLEEIQERVKGYDFVVAVLRKPIQEDSLTPFIA